MSNSLEIDDQSVNGSSLEHESSKQKIILQGNDNSNTYSIYSDDIEIVVSKNSSQSRINASNKIKVNRIVNYEWEQRYNYGNMIAVHKSGQYFAYIIRTADSSNKVKVFNRKLNEKVLLKSFKGRVVDLSFAYYDKEVLLGCVDETGCLQIFEITLDSDSKMQTNLVLNLAPAAQGSLPGTANTSLIENGKETPTQRSLSQTSKNSNINRIIWCMYIPESNNVQGELNSISVAEDASKVFVLTRKNRADIFHLDLVKENYDCSAQLESNDIKIGHLVIDEHKSSILTASFSPDGSAIATASFDGEVNFFKITFLNNPDSPTIANETNQTDASALNEENEMNRSESGNDLNSKKLEMPQPPKCLQKWKPHNNKPVFSLYFLDDHKNPTPDAQFWSFILTGADFNREIKIWSCIKWECLQTIQFSIAPQSSSLSIPLGLVTSSNEEDKIHSAQNSSLSLQATSNNSNQAPLFKTCMDLSASYLVMSDVTRKCFYVLHLHENVDTNVARCTAISEYLLAYPALSFAIIDNYRVNARKYNQLNNVDASAPSFTLGLMSKNSNSSNSLANDDEAISLELTSGSGVGNLSTDLANQQIPPIMSSSSSSSSLHHGIQNNSSASTLTPGQQAANTDLVTMIRLYCIQTKQLQEMQIYLTGDQSINAYNNNSSTSPTAFQTNIVQSSLSQSQSTVPSANQSILNQLLPNASSPMSSQQGLNSLSHNKQSNQQLKLSGSGSRLKTSNSLSADLKENFISSDDYDNEVSSLINNKKQAGKLIGLKSSSGNNSSSSLNNNTRPNMLQPLIKTSLSNQAIPYNEDSAIIQIVTPTPQSQQQISSSSAISILPTPLLLTPDAFLNSPTNGRKSNKSSTTGIVGGSGNVNSSTTSGEQKIDILQSLLMNSSVQASTSTNVSSLNNNSNNNNVSVNNLLSSRTSSLTQVTAPLAGPTSNNSSTANANASSNASKVFKNSAQSNKKKMNRQGRNRSSSSSSSSSCSSSSTSSSSTTSSSSSIMADKEIAALSSSSNNNTNFNKISSSASNSLKNNNLKTESLLNKVVIDNDDSFTNQVEKVGKKIQPSELDQHGGFQLASKGFGVQLNEKWPNPPNCLSENGKATSNPTPPASSNSILTSTAPIYLNEENTQSNTAYSSSVTDLKSLLVQMTQALRLQQEEIENLKKHQINSQLQLKSQIDTTLKQFLINQQQQLSRTSQLQSSLNPISDETGQLGLSIQQVLNENLQPKLEKLVKEEISKCFQSQFFTRLMDPLREQVSRDLAEKLKSIENVIKDSVVKLFKSKTTIDTLSQSIVGSSQAAIVNSYRETFQKVIVPNFEKSCQNMYQQVNNSFAKGTQDYLIEFDQLAKQHRKMFDDNKEPILAQMKQFNEQIRNNTQFSSNLVENLQQQFDNNLRNSNAVLQDTIISSVKAIIKEELHLAMKDQQLVLPDRLISQMRQSGTITPINHAQTPGSNDPNSFFQTQQQAVNNTQDIQMQITQFIKKGMYNNAFQTVLCAADLGLLENICEIVPPSQAFDQSNQNKSKLQQPVILSLIQQLSQDLNSNTELKIKYLEEAICNLDMSIPLTIEHTPIVMAPLVQKLNMYMQAHPNDKIFNNMRMLMHLAKSYLTNNKPQQQQQQQQPVGGLLGSSIMNSQSKQLQQQQFLKKNLLQQQQFESL